MGTDRELLERAARAAGIEGTPYELYPGQWWIEIRATEPNAPPTLWNPLVDDGNALRLAVAINQLNLLLLLDLYGDAALYRADPTAATRRAIVRAAAMPEGGQG